MSVSQHVITLLGLRALEYVEAMGLCQYCGRPMIFQVEKTCGKQTDMSATVEHITPKRCKRTATRGKHKLSSFISSRSNRIAVCRWCNAHRSDRPLTDWIATLRENGLTGGIVSRIRSLVDDWMPSDEQASDFSKWMESCFHRTPSENIVALPESIADVLEPVLVRR